MTSIINFSKNVGKQFDIKDKLDISNTIVLGEFKIQMVYKLCRRLLL